MALDLKHLQTQEKTTTVKTDVGDFDVTFNPGAAKRKWQTMFAKLQRDMMEATQDGDEEAEADLKEQMTEKLQELIKDWDLTEDGEKLPVDANTMDEIPLGIQRQIFESVIGDAAGGDQGNSRRRSSRR